MSSARFAQFSEPVKEEVRKKRDPQWPAALLITGLVLAFYLLDSALQEIGQASGAIDKNLLLELCGVVVCLILPALYMQFGYGSSRSRPQSKWTGASHTDKKIQAKPAMSRPCGMGAAPIRTSGLGQQTRSFSPVQNVGSQHTRTMPKPKLPNRRQISNLASTTPVCPLRSALPATISQSMQLQKLVLQTRQSVCFVISRRLA